MYTTVELALLLATVTLLKEILELRIPCLRCNHRIYSRRCLCAVVRKVHVYWEMKTIIRRSVGGDTRSTVVPIEKKQ